MGDNFPKMIEQSPHSETREKIPLNSSVWLGAVFEVGGGMGFMISRKRYAYPYIQYHDTDRARVQHIFSSLGGEPHLLHPKLNSWKFRISNEKVPSIVEEIKPFASSRQKMIAAFEQWESVSVRERMEIAQQHRARDRVNVAVEEYVRLLTNPNFLAGVIDARGIWSPSKTRDKSHPRLLVVTRNKPLLNALQSLYGGKVKPSKFNEKDLFQEVKSFTWALTHQDKINKVIQAAQDYLHFPHQVKLSS